MFGGSRRKSVASAELPGRAPLAESDFRNTAFQAPVLKKAAATPPAPPAQTADHEQAAAEASDARRAFELPPRPGKRPAATAADEERARAQRARADPNTDLAEADAADARYVVTARRLAGRARRGA
jgi:hypothetical protein